MAPGPGAFRPAREKSADAPGRDGRDCLGTCVFTEKAGAARPLPEEVCCAEMVREAIMENSGNPEGYMEFYPGYILWVLNDGSISVILEPY
mgnify:CR=1 FL=1